MEAAVQTKDPKVVTQEYADKHRLHELLQGLLAELIFHKPANPTHYLVMQLEKIKVAGTRPLLDKQDLDTMFAMFDVTNKGAVTEQQAAAALRTVLGGGTAVGAAAAGASSTLALDKAGFVQHMQTALCSATPLCKGPPGDD